jgi:putative oxidoreductase
MLTRILRTDSTATASIIRIALGAVMLPHGAQHALGWFGGYGFHGTLGWMTGTLGFPAPMAALAIATELVAPYLLILGLCGRLAGLGIFGIMLGAVTTHWANGFFMNWFGGLPAGTEGFEYHLIAMTLAAVVVLQGSGAWSLDRWIAARLAPRTGALRSD